MRGGIAAVVAVGLLSTLAASARAQSGHRGAGGALGGFSLITLPAVEKELKLDHAQIQKAKAVSEEMKEKFEKTMESLQKLHPEEQLKKLPALAETHYEEGMKALGAFLKPAQLDRFDQLLFQQRGASAMLEPASEKHLKLTKAQAKEIGELLDAARNHQKQLFEAAKGNMKEAAPKLAAIGHQVNTKAVALLTPAQKKAWRSLTGESFEVKGEGF